MIFKIKEDFWSLTVTCLFCTVEALGNHIEDTFGAEMAEVVDHIDDAYLGTCVMMPTGELLMWMPQEPKTPAHIGTVAHEAFHLTKHVLGEVQGIPLSEDTEEVYALLQGRLVERILNRN